MKAPRTIKKWVNEVRRLYGKKNGVIPYFGDHMGHRMEVMMDNNKRLVSHKPVRIEEE